MCKCPPQPSISNTSLISAGILTVAVGSFPADGVLLQTHHPCPL
ncbi:rCG49965, partial [Rattus norvegicus]